MNRDESIQYLKEKKAGYEHQHQNRYGKETSGRELLSEENIKPLLSPLLWDRNVDEEYYLQLLKKDRRTSAEEKELQALYIKILNFNNWHTVVKNFGIKYAVENMLTEHVIRGLFPRPLRKKYEFVRHVLSEAV